MRNTVLDGERVLLDDLEVGELAVEYETQEPEDVIEWAFKRFGDRRLGLITSFQADGMALLDMAYKINPLVRVITIDTGRLPQEQYDIIEEVRQRYAIDVEILFPESAAVETMTTKHGTNLFYQSVQNRLLCCQVRKVLPLNRALKGLDAWITGLRRDQWATRANLKKIEVDHDHGGIVKLAPLVDWTHDDVWDYIRENDLPVHPLYAKGVTSIGCAPCTRAVAEGADPRSGRWWWETDAPKECGMHCSIETGGFEHELEAILGDKAHDDNSHSNGRLVELVGAR
jgi:thioredoxin-dependent adenylylsulfate APS reductase